MNERPVLRSTALASLLWLAFAAGAGAQAHVSRTLSVEDGLVHPQVLLLYQRGRFVRVVGEKEGLPAGVAIGALAEGRDGTIYPGTNHGLFLFRHGAVLNPGRRGFGPHAHVDAIALAPDGRVFLGTYPFGAFLGPPTGSFESITTENGQTWSSVHAVHVTGRGTFYFGTERGAGVYEPGARVESWTRGAELHDDSILSMLPAGAEAASCTCPLAWSSLQQWGAGSTCAAAIASFQNNAEFQAYLNCGMLGRDVCDIGSSSHSPCRFENGMWKVDGTLQYKCLRCSGEPV